MKIYKQLTFKHVPFLMFCKSSSLIPTSDLVNTDSIIGNGGGGGAQLFSLTSEHSFGIGGGGGGAVGADPIT